MILKQGIGHGFVQRKGKEITNTYNWIIRQDVIDLKVEVVVVLNSVFVM